jgi:hypothetical protein
MEVLLLIFHKENIFVQEVAPCHSDRLPGFYGPGPSAALDKSIYFSTLLYILFYHLSICFSAFFLRKLGKELSLVKSGFNEPDFTFRLIYINTSLLLFSLPLGCLFSVRPENRQHSKLRTKHAPNQRFGMFV